MNVGLDQTVTVTDAYGHHGIDCDPMGRKMATDGEKNIENMEI